MFDISVAEILRRHGKWIDSSGFAELVADKRKVTERQAYNLIKRAYKNKEVERFLFQDRKAIYGLAEFGPPLEQESHIKKDSELTYEDKIRLIELAARMSKTGTPLLTRDVHLRMGNETVKVEHGCGDITLENEKERKEYEKLSERVNKASRR